MTSTLLFAILCVRADWQTADRRSRLGKYIHIHKHIHIHICCQHAVSLHFTRHLSTLVCTQHYTGRLSLCKYRKQLTSPERPSTSGVLLNDNRVTSVRAKSRPTDHSHASCADNTNECNWASSACTCLQSRHQHNCTPLDQLVDFV